MTVNGDIMTFNGTFTLARVIDATTPVIGSWFMTTPNNHRVVFTFFANGDYVLAEDGLADLAGQTGMERGTYTWNAGTGAFATGGCPPVNTNGEWGLSHQIGGVCSGWTGTVAVSGNTLTLADTGGTFTLARVIP